MISNLAATSLGDYACTVPITLFTQKRGSSSAANPEVIRLKGRRMVTMQEPDEAVALNTGIMKLVSSGEKMYARDLFKSGVEFEVQAQFLFSCNKMPEINTNDGGTWRRLIVVHFASKFVHHAPVESYEFPIDDTIQKKVESKAWATPFLNYMVHLIKEGKSLRKITPPTSVLKYTQEYRNENDSIAKFISEKLAEVKEGDEIVPVTKADLRRTFRTWMTDNGLKLAPLDMEKAVEKQFGEFKRGGWTKFKIIN
jgi:P4 family phage/plasmid primase-like protien